MRLAGDVTDARDVGQAGHVARAAERPDTGRERPHLLLLQLARGAVGVPDCREDQVGNGLGRFGGVRGVNGGRADGQVHQVTLPVDLGLHQPASRAALDHRLGEFLLSVHELVLHLLRCREQLLHIDLAARIHCALTRYRHARTTHGDSNARHARRCPVRSGGPRACQFRA